MARKLFHRKPPLFLSYCARKESDQEFCRAFKDHCAGHGVTGSFMIRSLCEEWLRREGVWGTTRQEPGQ